MRTLVLIAIFTVMLLGCEGSNPFTGGGGSSLVSQVHNAANKASTIIDDLSQDAALPEVCSKISAARSEFRSEMSNLLGYGWNSRVSVPGSASSQNTELRNARSLAADYDETFRRLEDNCRYSL